MTANERTEAEIREILADPGRKLVCVANTRRPVRGKPPVYDGGIAEVVPEGIDKDGTMFSWRTIIKVPGPFTDPKAAKRKAAKQLAVYVDEEPEAETQPERSSAGSGKRN